MVPFEQKGGQNLKNLKKVCEIVPEGLENQENLK